MAIVTTNVHHISNAAQVRKVCYRHYVIYYIEIFYRSFKYILHMLFRNVQIAFDIIIHIWILSCAINVHISETYFTYRLST